MSSGFMGRVLSTSLLVAASLVAVQADPALKLTLSGPATVTDVDNFFVIATIGNSGDETLALYPEPRGLLSSSATQSFKVTRANGNGAARFNGIVAKYSFDQATNLVTLAPGEKTDVTHQLARAYNFESSGTGAYSVDPDYTLFYYKDPVTGAATPITATVVNSYTAKVQGSLKSHQYERRKAKRELSRSESLAKRTLGKRDISVKNCAASLKNDVVLSAQTASLYVADAEKYLTLTGTSATSERYTTWFGAFDQSNHDRVLDHYAKIRKSDLKTYIFDCECTEGSDVFAYVFPDEFGHVHLCDQYIAAAIGGTDSKAGTIVHESTHFTLNGGTKDLAYGKPRAMALAVSNATAATMNADSHEYFAENTPLLA